MTLNDFIPLLQQCAERMDKTYGGIVFDEWAVLGLKDRSLRLLHYCGPRRTGFLKEFLNDAGAIRAELFGNEHSTGDFEFARNGLGTMHDLFLVLGEGIFLIGNNTTRSMQEITGESAWRQAQVGFVEFTDRLRGDPLVHIW